MRRSSSIAIHGHSGGTSWWSGGLSELSTTHFFADLGFPLLVFFVDPPIPVALVPASAAPATAPVAAPATAPEKTSRATFLTLLMMPGELGLRDFLRPFLLDADETDFFAPDRFFVFFLVAIASLCSLLT